MKKKLISLPVAAAMIMTFLPVTVSAQANINIGEYVQMGTYYGEPILWRCVDIDENGPLMLSDKVICVKPFDAAGHNEIGSHGRGYQDFGMHSGDFDRRRNGSNYWADSNIRCWLNSDASAGNVNWACGNAPTKYMIFGGENEYADEAGFLTNFTTDEKIAIKPVTQKSLLNGFEYDSNNRDSNYHRFNNNIDDVLQNYDTAFSEQVTDSVFLLDVKQINAVYNNSNILGDNYYMGKPTEQVKAAGNYFEWSYWLRTPETSGADGIDVRCVDYTGNVSASTADTFNLGVRPAFYLNLSSSSFASGSGTSEAPYTVEVDDDYIPDNEAYTVTDFGSIVSTWAKQEIDEAYSENLIPKALVGKDLTQKIVRAEFAAIAVTLYEELSNKKSDAGENPFNDIDINACQEDILKAYNLGITNGISETEFAPSALISREQAATMLTRAYKKSEFIDWTPATDENYTLDCTGVKKYADDDEISPWAKESVYFMTCSNIITGVDSTHFAPKNSTAFGESYGYATREQAVVIALRSLKNLR